MEPQGKLDLELGEKGFFILIFSILEYRIRVFERRPYFLNNVGIFMKFWKEWYNLEKEHFLAILVWV